MKVRAIVNPNAGVAARAAMDAMRRAEAPWTGFDLQLTKGPGDARRLAREAFRPDEDTERRLVQTIHDIMDIRAAH